MNTPKIVIFAPLSNIDNIQRSHHWESDDEIRDMYAVTGCHVYSIEPDYDTIYGRNWERDADLVHSLIVDELDGRTPKQDEHIKQYFGGVKVITSAEWRKHHL